MKKSKPKKKAAPAKAKPNATKFPFIVLGRGDDDKPKGARFEAAQFDAASAASAALNFEIFEARSGELLEIAKELPAGRVYARGRTFVPFIKEDLYQRVHVASGGLLRDQAKSEGQIIEAEKDLAQLQKHLPTDLPTSWDDLAVGQLVISSWNGEEEWWPCVISERNGDVLTLKFKDYPKHKPFLKHIKAVALLCPPPQPIAE